MPFYDYRYTTKAGEVKVVERRFSMAERPDTLLITDEDGEDYEARFVILRPHANTASKWRVGGTDSTLPAENSPALSQADVPPSE
jgi:hypothetical protein